MLANYILHNVTGEPSQNESAVPGIKFIGDMSTNQEAGK